MSNSINSPLSRPPLELEPRAVSASAKEEDNGSAQSCPAAERPATDDTAATGRSVAEWVGATADTPVPKRVKLRVLIAYGGRCYRTKHKFRPGDPIEFDHIQALCNGGENRESNLAPILGGKAHRDKTAADVAIKSKTARTRAKHMGLWPKSPTPLKSRNSFPKRHV